MSIQGPYIGGGDYESGQPPQPSIHYSSPTFEPEYTIPSSFERPSPLPPYSRGADSPLPSYNRVAGSPLPPYNRGSPALPSYKIITDLQ